MAGCTPGSGVPAEAALDVSQKGGQVLGQTSRGLVLSLRLSLAACFALLRTRRPGARLRFGPFSRLWRPWVMRIDGAISHLALPLSLPVRG